MLEITICFLTILYGFGVILYTTYGVGRVIAKKDSSLMQRSIQTPYLGIGISALFLRGSEANLIAKKIELKLTLIKFLWIPLPILMSFTAFLLLKS